MKKLVTILLALVFACGLAVMGGCKQETLLEFDGLFVEDETFNYDEQYHSLTLSGIENYKDATVSLTVETVTGGTADEQGEVGEGGVYTYVYTVSQKGYKTATVKGTLTINRVDPKFYIPLVSNLVWNGGEPIDVTVSTNFEQQNLIVAKYYYGDEEIGKGDIRAAGNYSVVVSVPQTNSYNAKTETIRFTVYEPAFNVSFYVYNPASGTLILDDPESTETFVRQISHNETLDLEGIEGGVNLNYDGYDFEGWFVGKVGAAGVVEPTDIKLNDGEKYSYNEAIKVVAKFKKKA